MKTLNIPLEDEEHEKLSEEKGDLTWREFLIKIANSGVWLKGTVESEPRNSWGKEWTFDEPLEFDKPCHKCGYCLINVDIVHMVRWLRSFRYWRKEMK